jgi:MFS family permease
LGALALRRRGALWAVAGSLLATLWPVVTVDNCDNSRLRLQSLSYGVAMLLAGAGAQLIASRLAPRWRRPLLAALWLCLAAESLSRLPAARAAENAQVEYAFLRQTLPRLPKDCAIVMPDRFMSERRISTEFPTWWLGKRRLSEQAAFLASAPPPGCALYYFGLSCQTFTREEAPPVDGVRPECRELERRFQLIPFAEWLRANAPDGFMQVPNAALRYGFYRLSRTT